MIVALLQDKVFCIAAMQLVAFVASAGARIMRANLIISHQVSTIALTRRP
jgi:hypothetical protein